MAERPTVYYDGGCPVCSREINFYRGIRVFFARDRSDFSSAICR
jgi:predicted DCC family thiol-disulfide oxidoreductase YuxK